MVTVANNWVMWNPDEDVAVHVDFSSNLRISVSRRGGTTTQQAFPLQKVDAVCVTAADYLLVTLDTCNGDSLKIRVTYDGEETTLQLEGMGYLVNAKLQEG